MILSRRSILGFIAAAPFIVKAASIMPVRALVFGDNLQYFTSDGTYHPVWARALFKEALRHENFYIPA